MRVRTCLMALLFATAGAVAADLPEVEPAQLERAGAATALRMEQSPVSWTAEHTISPGYVITVSVLRAGEKSHTVITQTTGGKKERVLGIIGRDGFWYVSLASGNFKYRPYEIPLDSTTLYICLALSQPRFETPETTWVGQNPDTVEGSIATFRRRPTKEQEQTMRGTLAAAESQDPKLLSPQTQASLAKLKDVLENGLPIRANIKTGQIVDFAFKTVHTRVTDVKFLGKVDEAEFEVKGKKWQDFADDPTTGNLDDLMMAANDALAQAGSKQSDYDGRLLNVVTGRFRRIPFAKGMVMPGCFLKDRRSVIAMGFDVDTGSLRPYRIDLKTQKSRPLGGEALASSMTLGPDLSPDGKTLLVSHMTPSFGTQFTVQLYLVDVETGGARPLGQPLDTSFTEWTADGQHIVLVDRTKGRAATSIAIMDLKGDIKVLRAGDQPHLLADRKTILYTAPETQLWHTCDLNGEHDALFADGLKGHAFLEPAPDGKRLFAMHLHPGGLPEMEVIPIGEAEGSIIDAGPGLWAMPAWK